MAISARSRPVVDHVLDLDIHEDGDAHELQVQRTPSSSALAVPGKFQILGDLPLTVQNIKPSVDTLAVELDNFHIHSPVKENLLEQPAARAQGRRIRVRSGQGSFHIPRNTPVTGSSEDYAVADMFSQPSEGERGCASFFCLGRVCGLTHECGFRFHQAQPAGD